MTLLEPSHHDVRLSTLEKKTVRLWIESGAPYAGTYAALGTGMVGAKLPAKVMERRCGACHGPNKTPDARVLPIKTYAGELQCNLSDPAQSPILLAPLSVAAGGWGLCEGEGASPRNSKPDHATV